MTTNEAAELLRVSRRTLYKWRHSGKIHGRRAGKRVLYDPDELQAVLREANGTTAERLEGVGRDELARMSWQQARELAAERRVSMDDLARWQDGRQ
jgi:excisionase family DNA binding protein